MVRIGTSTSRSRSHPGEVAEQRRTIFQHDDATRNADLRGREPRRQAPRASSRSSSSRASRISGDPWFGLDLPSASASTADPWSERSRTRSSSALVSSRRDHATSAARTRRRATSRRAFGPVRWSRARVGAFAVTDSAQQMSRGDARVLDGESRSAWELHRAPASPFAGAGPGAFTQRTAYLSRRGYPMATFGLVQLGARPRAPGRTWPGGQA